MSKTTQEMWELRNNFYNWLADFVKANSREVKELRKPTEERGKRKKGKIIGIVESVIVGKQIDGEIFLELSDVNKKLKALGDAAGLSVTPIKVKVEVIDPLDDVLLTEQAAQRRVSAEGTEIRQEIKAYIDYLKKQETPDKKEIETAEELYKAVKASELYIRASDSGNSYRVTYYNAIDKCRKQQNVGDVLLIAGGDFIRLLEAPKRKERADKAKQLGTYYKRLLGSDEMMLCRVYAFDKRYIKRRTQRLDNK